MVLATYSEVQWYEDFRVTKTTFSFILNEIHPLGFDPQLSARRENNLIPRESGFGHQDVGSFDQKIWDGTPEKQAPATYSHAPGTPKFLGTGAHKISIYTIKTEGPYLKC